MSPQLGELILPPQSGSSAPTPLAHWKAVRGLTAARQVNVLFDGDSVAEGTAVATRDLRWQDKVIAALRTAYPSGAVGGEGYVPGEYVSSTMTDRFSTTGTTITGTYVNETGAAVGTKFGLGVRYLRLAAGATATITGICTGFDLHFARGGNAADPGITVDGGAITAPTSLAANAGGFSSSGYRFKVRGLTAGSHPVVISAASSFVYLEGITFYNGDESKGIIQYDAGHSGYHAADMLDVINYGVLGMVQPDLAVVAFGLNEYSQAFTSGATGTRTPSQMRADLYALVRQLRFQCVTPPSIVIAKMYPRGGSFVSPAPLSEYLAAYDDVVTMAGGDIATWDAGTVITDLASGNASGYGHTDLLHLTAAGHTAYAAGLTSFLTAA